MDAFEFILKYPHYISELKEIIKPELLHVIEELECKDPHDLITPESWFINQNQARGFVLSLFLNHCKKR